MVIPEQVEDAMDHQKDEHFSGSEAESIRLTFGRFHRNDQVSQKTGVKCGELSFRHGEGKDVGGLVTVKVSAIQLSNPGIINEHDDQFGLRSSQLGQYHSGSLSYSS